MYEQIENLMNLIDEKANVIIQGDFNASVGEQNNSSNCLEKFGFGNLNERGARLLNFCEQLEMTFTNTFFQVPKRRRYTWKAPGDYRRFQIDYILVKQKYRNKLSLATLNQDVIQTVIITWYQQSAILSLREGLRDPSKNSARQTKKKTQKQRN